MARTREFDADRAIEAIAEQFWAGGYDATGIAELVEATGVGRASLYGAFGSKHDMLLQAIDFYLNERIEKMVESVEAGGLDAATSIFRKFAFVRETMPERSQMGCLMVNTSIELASSDPDVAVLAERFRNRHRRAFRVSLTKAVDGGEIVGPIEERVDIATMLLLGLFVAIRGAAPLEEIKRLSGAAAAVVQSWRVPALSEVGGSNWCSTIAVMGFDGHKQHKALTALERTVGALGKGDAETSQRAAGRAAEFDQIGVYKAVSDAITRIVSHQTDGTEVPSELWDGLLEAVGPGQVAAVVEQLRDGASSKSVD